MDQCTRLYKACKFVNLICRVHFQQLYTKLRISYYSKGCTMPEIWDVEDPANKGKEPLCLVMVRDPKPYFKQVYKNEKFDVFKVLNVDE